MKRQGCVTSNMVVKLWNDRQSYVKNKHDPAKQLKKAGTAGQESTVFGTYQKAEQVEPINTLLLQQEIVKWKNQPSEMTQHCLSFIRQEETE